jgi:hypothetical protein
MQRPTQGRALGSPFAHRQGEYDFGAGWGKENSEFILPISPKVALYTKIGDRATGPFTFSHEQTTVRQRPARRDRGGTLVSV